MPWRHNSCGQLLDFRGQLVVFSASVARYPSFCRSSRQSLFLLNVPLVHIPQSKVLDSAPDLENAPPAL
jgi:hypothetical protein